MDKHRIDKALGLPVEKSEDKKCISELDNACADDATNEDDSAMSSGTKVVQPEGSWKWAFRRSTVGYVVALCSYVMVALSCDIRVTGACTSIWLMFFLVRSRFFQAGFEQ